MLHPIDYRLQYRFKEGVNLAFPKMLSRNKNNIYHIVQHCKLVREQFVCIHIPGRGIWQSITDKAFFQTVQMQMQQGFPGQVTAKLNAQALHRWFVYYERAGKVYAVWARQKNSVIMRDQFQRIVKINNCVFLRLTVLALLLNQSIISLSFCKYATVMFKAVPVTAYHLRIEIRNSEKLNCTNCWQILKRMGAKMEPWGTTVLKY